MIYTILFSYYYGFILNIYFRLQNGIFRKYFAFIIQINCFNSIIIFFTKSMFVEQIAVHVWFSSWFVLFNFLFI